jgi:hypothetical protein
MTRRTVVTWLTVLSLLALLARIGTIVYLKAWAHPSAMEHRSIALQLVHGDGFSFGDWGYFGPTSVQSPTFPFLLAGLFKIFGDDSPRAYQTIMLLNALAGAATVWLTYALARTLGGTVLTGLLAAAAVAIWPSQVYAGRSVQAIALITCTLLGSIILFYRSVRSGALAPWLGFSVVGIIAAITEPVFLPAMALSGLLILAWRSLPWSIRLRNAAVLLMVTFALVGPWTLRNYIVHGRLMPVKGTFWVNLWKGNNDYATGTDRLALTPQAKARAKTKGDNFDDDLPDTAHQYDMLDLSQKARLKHQPESVRETVFKEFALQWIQNNPKRYLHLCGVRLMKTLTVDWDNPRSYNTVYIVSRFLLLGLTTVGLIFAWRQRWSLGFAGLMAGVALMTYTLTVTAARFGIPFEPIQLCLGAACIAAIFERQRPRRQPGFEVTHADAPASPAMNAAIGECSIIALTAPG